MLKVHCGQCWAFMTYIRYTHFITWYTKPYLYQLKDRYQSVDQWTCQSNFCRNFIIRFPMNAYALYLRYRLIAAKGPQYMYDYKSCEDCVSFLQCSIAKG